MYAHDGLAANCNKPDNPKDNCETIPKRDGTSALYHRAQGDEGTRSEPHSH